MPHLKSLAFALLNERIKALHDAGWSVPKIAASFGVSPPTISKALRGMGIAPRRHNHIAPENRRGGRPKGALNKVSPAAAERSAAMVAAFCSGLTLEQVGQQHGVSRERVRQVLRKAGVSSKDGGRSIRAAGIRAEVVAYRERQLERRAATWGMEPAEYKAHVAEFGSTSKRGTPARQFLEQRRNLRRFNIPIRMTFKEWLGVWEESGHWAERGRGKYVMTRLGNTGAFEVGNVRVITQSQLSKDGYLYHPGAERAAKARVTREARLAA